MTHERRDIVNLADLELHWMKTGARFEVGLGNVHGALGTHMLGATLHVVPAGKTAWPYHVHHGADEIFLVLSGTGEYRVGERRLPIKPGDCIGAPAGGEAHQIINSFDGELRYIAFATHGLSDVIEYPDSGKVSVDIAHAYDKESIFSLEGRMTPADYWDGEDIEEEGK